MKFEMELISDESYESETTITVLGIKLFLVIDCKFEYGESENINSDNFVFFTGDNHDIVTGGGWHEAICEIVQDDVIERICKSLKGVA